jgi:hypothetical protein
MTHFRKRRERGATLVEMALVAPMFFLALFAVIELGLAFKDYLTVSSGARDGARAGSVFGNDQRADILVLRGVQNSLAVGGVGGSGQVRVQISDPDGGSSTTYTYLPGTGCSGGSCCDWSPCPDPAFPGPIYQVPNWNPVSRDVSAPFTDRISVRVSYDHKWLTKFFFNTTTFSVGVTHQIEPQVFE